MDFQVVIKFDSDQMFEAIEKNTGKIVNRSRVDLLGLLVATIQEGISDADPKAFLGGMMLMGWDSIFEALPGGQDLFLDV